jgi:hypothetical protein
MAIRRAAGAGQAIYTDDVSLRVFMEHLKRLVRVSVFTYLDAMCLCVVFLSGGCRRTDELHCDLSTIYAYDASVLVWLRYTIW